MKKTLFAAAAAVMMLAAAGAADEKALSSAQEIARYESGGELARDPAEKPVDAPKDMKLILCIALGSPTWPGAQSRPKRTGRWCRARTSSTGT